MKILITELYTLPEDVKERFINAGFPVDYADGSTVIDPKDYEVVYGQRPFNTYPYASFTNLKFVQLSSAGLEHLPIKDWIKDKVLVSSAKGVYSAPIAEMIVMNILMGIKKVPQFMRSQKDHQWKKELTRELGSLKILFLGTGSIASEAATRLDSFGPLLIGLNSNGRSIVPFNVCGPLSEVTEYLKSADVIVNTLPLNEDTVHLMDEKFFASLKPQSIFINIGRGKSVDETALLKALDTDQLAYVYLDVFEEEPLNAKSPLWAHPKVFLTPHNSGISPLTYERNYTLLLNNIQHYLNHEPLENQL